MFLGPHQGFTLGPQGFPTPGHFLPVELRLKAVTKSWGLWGQKPFLSWLDIYHCIDILICIWFISIYIYIYIYVNPETINNEPPGLVSWFHRDLWDSGLVIYLWNNDWRFMILYYGPCTFDISKFGKSCKYMSKWVTEHYRWSCFANTSDNVLEQTYQFICLNLYIYI